MNPTPLPEAIDRFLSRSRVATVCFSGKQNPHAINCFFAHDARNMHLIFKSSEGSNHDFLAIDGGCVAGTVLPDMISLSGLRGLQFRGVTLRPGEFSREESGKIYAEKFQFSRFLPGYIWVVAITFAKFTDNRVRFGYKITWQP